MAQLLKALYALVDWIWSQKPHGCSQPTTIYSCFRRSGAFVWFLWEPEKYAVNICKQNTYTYKIKLANKKISLLKVQTLDHEVIIEDWFINDG